MHNFVQPTLKDKVINFKMMKKLLILTVLLTGFSFTSLDANAKVKEKSCFQGARELVIILDGEINIDNVGLVNDLTAACENGDITFN
ncbi:hypothetical protein GCM10008088_21730 [Mesonia mobilis]|uniref:Uncharacterized protein n=1 Tax=Mesonia mobilis TaxID=369791 RepID=A0ABQ3BWQ8_9FLAO|nr:hypothetical protein GCM10008088_21730 [Mesonia mobilis]